MKKPKVDQKKANQKKADKKKFVQVLSLKVKMGPQIFKGTQTTLQSFIIESGFSQINVDSVGYLHAVAPASEDDQIVIEHSSACSIYNMVRLTRGQPTIIDTGAITMTIPLGEQSEMTLSGANMTCFDVLVKPSSITEIVEQETSFIPDCDVVTDRTDTRDRFPMWKTSPSIVAFMNKYCGGPCSAETFANVYKQKVAESGLSNSSYAEKEFTENPVTILGLLLVLKLHEDLRPLVDRKIKDPKKITFNVLRILYKIPIEKQVGVWKKVKRLKRSDQDRQNELRRLAKEYEELAKVSPPAKPVEPSPA